MTSTLPSYIHECVTKGAEPLGRALDELDWPNGDKDAPCSELNAILNFQYFMARLEPTFYFYSEGTIAYRGKNGRVDLVGSNGAVALALEAKTFGRINAQSQSIKNDLDRLRGYVPATSKPQAPFQLTDWWQRAEQRWGLLLISSFRGQEVRDAWESRHLDQAFAIMQSYTKASDRPPDRDSGLMALLKEADMQRFSARITHSSKWGPASNGWLLCGAIPLA